MSRQAEIEWWLKTAASLDWTFAKTMKDTPHSYIVRGKQLDEHDFQRAVRCIRAYGEPGKFFSRTNVYLVHPGAGHRWWTMGDTLAGTVIINQAPHDQVYGKQDAPRTYSGIEVPFYDDLAPEYDDRYTRPSDLEENAKITRLIAEHAGQYAPRMLDIGCGTGLALDLRLTHPSLYTGVDPSQAMLNELVRKHTKVTSLLPGRWEDMARRAGQGYDLIVSLFGSASYISPEFIPVIPKLCRSGGLTVLMHYREGYQPDYEAHTRLPLAKASREAAAAIPGAHVFALNNFQVVTVKRD